MAYRIIKLHFYTASLWNLFEFTQSWMSIQFMCTSHLEWEESVYLEDMSVSVSIQILVRKYIWEDALYKRCAFLFAQHFWISEIGRVDGVMTTQWQPTSCIILWLCEPMWATREIQFKVKSWSRVSKKDLYDVIKVKGAKVEQLSFFIH